MITILHRGGGSLGTPKSDYVICARPLNSLKIKIVRPNASISLVTDSSLVFNENLIFTGCLDDLLHREF